MSGITNILEPVNIDLPAGWACDKCGAQAHKFCSDGCENNESRRSIIRHKGPLTDDLIRQHAIPRGYTLYYVDKGARVISGRLQRFSNVNRPMDRVKRLVGVLNGSREEYYHEQIIDLEDLFVDPEHAAMYAAERCANTIMSAHMAFSCFRMRVQRKEYKEKLEHGLDLIQHFVK